MAYPSTVVGTAFNAHMSKKADCFAIRPTISVKPPAVPTKNPQTSYFVKTETTSSSWTWWDKLTFCACGENLLDLPQTRLYRKFGARDRWIPLQTSSIVAPFLKQIGSERSGQDCTEDDELKSETEHNTFADLRSISQLMTTVFGSRASLSVCSRLMASILL